MSEHLPEPEQPEQPEQPAQPDSQEEDLIRRARIAEAEIMGEFYTKKAAEERKAEERRRRGGLGPDDVTQRGFGN